MEVMGKIKNTMEIEFLAVSQNEGLARVAVASFISTQNPTLEEISDVKTAVSEAVTNAIIHGYEGQSGNITMRCWLLEKFLHIEVEDKGKGIVNIEKAMEPLFTTKPEMERSGMGFAFMEAFMDKLEVESIVGVGTKVTMEKELGRIEWLDE